MITREKLINTVGDFTWLWGNEFFIETSIGNFIWKDPDYQGDNTIRIYEGSYQQYIKSIGIEFGRSKGKHVIGDYCGKEFKFVG